MACQFYRDYRDGRSGVFDVGDRSSVSRGKDYASTAVLSRYQLRHMQITRPMYVGTNGIVRLFSNDTLPAKVLRGLVLRVANNFPPVKRLTTQTLTEKEAPISDNGRRLEIGHTP